MSDLGFDPRGYCERLAKACDRFNCWGDVAWQCNDLDNEATVFHGSDPANLWAFFGPIADERKIRPAALFETCATFWAHGSALESIISSVVESFESRNESEVKS